MLTPDHPANIDTRHLRVRARASARWCAFAAALLLGSPPPAVPASPGGSPPIVIDVSRAVQAALGALGDDVQLFTSRAHPLRAFTEIRHPGTEVGSADLELARGVLAFLRAGGVAFTGGAFEVMTLASDNELGSLFRKGSPLRLFVLRARPGAQPAIERGGGVLLQLHATGPAGQSADVPPPAAGVRRPSASPAPPDHPPPSPAASPARPGHPPTSSGAIDGVVTGFGPLRRVQRSETARHRTFVTSDQHPPSGAALGAQVEQRRPRPAHTFVVLHIDRDFSAGLGKVSYLFGSGVILAPDFAQLVLLDGSGRRYLPAAVYADGPTLELAYEVPAATRALRLQEGDRTWPLSERLARAP